MSNLIGGIVLSGGIHCSELSGNWKIYYFRKQMLLQIKNHNYLHHSNRLCRKHIFLDYNNNYLWMELIGYYLRESNNFKTICKHLNNIISCSCYNGCKNINRGASIFYVSFEKLKNILECFLFNPSRHTCTIVNYLSTKGNAFKWNSLINISIFIDSISNEKECKIKVKTIAQMCVLLKLLILGAIRNRQNEESYGTTNVNQLIYLIKNPNFDKTNYGRDFKQLFKRFSLALNFAVCGDKTMQNIDLCQYKWCFAYSQLYLVCMS